MPKVHFFAILWLINSKSDKWENRISGNIETIFWIPTHPISTVLVNRNVFNVSPEQEQLLKLLDRDAMPHFYWVFFSNEFVPGLRVEKSGEVVVVVELTVAGRRL